MVIAVVVAIVWGMIVGIKKILFDSPRPLVIKDCRIGRLGAGRDRKP